MLNIAVFCSGEGTNLQAIIDAVQAGDIKAKISLVISDKKEAPALQRAERAGIKAVFVHPVKSRTSRGAKQFNGVNSQNFSSKQEFETKLIDHLKKENIGLIVLAGFMRMLSLFLSKNILIKFSIFIQVCCRHLGVQQMLFGTP